MGLARRLRCAIPALLTVVLMNGQGANAEPPAAERYIGRVSTTNWATADLNLYMYGVYGVGVTGAMFNPTVISPNVKQVVTPYIRIPDGDMHRYRLDCQVRGDGPPGTTTDYRFSDRDGTLLQTRTQPQGPSTVSFEVSVDLDGPHSQYWLLSNGSGHSWLFIGCDVYELAA